MATATLPAQQTSAPAPTAARDQNRTGTVFYWVGGTLASLVFVIPLVWAVLRSFQPASLITAAPRWSDFTHFTVSNYSDLLGGQIRLWRYVVNSLIVSL